MPHTPSMHSPEPGSHMPIMDSQLNRPHEACPGFCKQQSGLPGMRSQMLRGSSHGAGPPKFGAFGSWQVGTQLSPPADRLVSTHPVQEPFTHSRL